MSEPRITYGQRRVTISELGRRTSIEDIGRIALALSQGKPLPTIKINGKTYQPVRILQEPQ